MQRRLPIVFILITVMIDAMGIGLIIPVMPDLIREVRGGDLAQAAIWGGILSTSFAVMQFLFGPLIGNLSDRYGRRPILLISLAVMAADYVVMALAGSIWLLLAGRLVGGITAATHSTAQAFMADITPPKERSARFGLISAGFGVGFVLGPLIGGVLGDLGTRAPFYAAAALASGNLILGYFVLPETVTDRTRRTFLWRRANPLAAFAAISRLPGLRMLVVVLFLYQLAFNVYPVIWAYFTQARFGWDASMIGISLAAFGISMALVQMTLIRPVIVRFGEVRTIIAGFGFAALSFILLAFITNGTIALILTPLSALASVTTPALQGMMSRLCPDDRQGELQGLMTSVSALSLILAPLLMTRIFAEFTGPNAPVFLPGAPFLASLALCLVGLVLFVAQRRKTTD